MREKLFTMFTMVSVSALITLFGLVSAQRAIAECTSQPSNLVSWWRAEINASDAVGGNHGSTKPDVNGTGYAQPGAAGNASFKFDGIDDYVQIGAKPNLVMTNAVSLEAWIYPTGPGSHSVYGGVIINKEGEYQIHRYANGYIWWAFANTNPGWWSINTGYLAPEYEWTHLVVVYNAGIVKTYANGVLVHTYNGSGNIGDYLPAMNDFRIGGRQYNSTELFKGWIDEVKVYNRALTAEEVQECLYLPSFQSNIIEQCIPEERQCWAAPGDWRGCCGVEQECSPPPGLFCGPAS